ncbi:FecCD family ABC transporter permease [Methanospirillum lacunae]|uniref:Cobalamin import system permease protein BtuC n=1 Tax=Methanospirillum lacunae TaxID=668570 RepID=A0A2V2MSU6_9EURY|nr:ABC transporter permease [Methanospirillum lacunae]
MAVPLFKKISHFPISLEIGLIVLSPFILAGFSMFFGQYFLDPITIFKILLSPFLHTQQTWTDAQANVIFNIRIPRIIGAFLIGGGLSVAGAVYQSLFRNPMVSPDILGVSSGAGFGAAIAILCSLPVLMIEGSAFFFGLASVGFAVTLAKIYKGESILVLVLSGIIMGSLFTSLISLVKYVADPTAKLPAITYWLMGSLSAVSMSDIFLAIPFILPGVVYCMVIGWRLNAFSLGDEEAGSLGIDTTRMKYILIFISTLITAYSVSICGIIGWIGLVIPHLGRMLIGPDNARLIPASFFLGAAYLILIDNIARNATSAEIPLGILTAIVGVPFFAYIMAKRDVGWT